MIFAILSYINTALVPDTLSMFKYGNPSYKYELLNV